MLLNPTSDQEFFRQTTARFLDELAAPDVIRRLRDDETGFGATYWQRGAELGWTSLLVGEDHGGGSISGEGLVDLTLIAHEFGRHAAPGPLLPTNVVAAALGDGTGDGHRELVANLMNGSVVASWCYGEPRPNDQLGQVMLDIRVEGAEVVVNGVKRPVEFGGQASHLLVTGQTAGGLTQVVVPRTRRASPCARCRRSISLAASARSNSGMSEFRRMHWWAKPEPPARWSSANSSWPW